MPTVTDIACPVCGCVCDDLRLTINGTQLVRAEGACPLAEPWFQSQSSTNRIAAEIERTVASVDEAVLRASQILCEARAPLIYGLSRSSTAGQRAAVRLADQLGATIDTTASLCHGPSIMAVQTVGESTCTLGEIRNRADLVIFWGCNPAVTHPRHAERYSVFPKGEFLPEGRPNRTIVMIGDRREVANWRLDPQGSRPDFVIPVEPDKDFEAINTLRAMLADIDVKVFSRDRGPQGANLGQLTDLAQRMKSARCGVIFFGLGLTGTGQQTDSSGDGNVGHLIVETLLRLVTELNAFTRFHVRRMRLYGDVAGADSVLCWQTGFPFSVNFARGYPRYNPGEYSAEGVLARGEADACVIIGSETLPQFSRQALDHLRRIPSVILDYPATFAAIQPTVHITTSPYGLHSPGTAYRMDEVPILLRAVFPAIYPTDADVLQRVSDSIARSSTLLPAS